MCRRDTSTADIAAAVKSPARPDVGIAVVGGSSARDFKTSYKETGAAVVDATTVSDMESGEDMTVRLLICSACSLSFLKL